MRYTEEPLLPHSLVLRGIVSSPPIGTNCLPTIELNSTKHKPGVIPRTARAAVTPSSSYPLSDTYLGASDRGKYLEDGTPSDLQISLPNPISLFACLSRTWTQRRLGRSVITPCCRVPSGSRHPQSHAVQGTLCNSSALCASGQRAEGVQPEYNIPNSMCTAVFTPFRFHSASATPGALLLPPAVLGQYPLYHHLKPHVYSTTHSFGPVYESGACMWKPRSFVSVTGRNRRFKRRMSFECFLPTETRKQLANYPHTVWLSFRWASVGRWLPLRLPLQCHSCPFGR